MKIRIKDGRESLWRWDTGRAIFVDDVDNVSRLDFNQSRKLSISVKDRNEDGSWNVPDVVLMSAEDVDVVAVYVDSQGIMSMVSAPLKIVDRQRPSDYIYTQDEVNTFTEAIRKVKELVEGVNDVDVQMFKVEDGVRLVTTDREGRKTSEVILNGKPGRDGKDADEYDDTEIKREIESVKGEVRRVAGTVEIKMMRVVLYLSQSGSTYVLRDKEGQDVTFEQLYNLVKDESNYVVILMGNSKLRPQYVSVNEIHCDGEDRDSQGALFLRMIMTPTSLYYGTFRLADKSEIVEINRNLAQKLTRPQSVEIGKYLRIASIDSEGNPVLEDVDLPLATSTSPGLLYGDANVGLNVESGGYLRGAIRTLAQYNSAATSMVISKGTLENIGDDFVYRHPREWVEVGKIDMSNVLNSLDVDLSDYKELCIIGACQGTANSNLTTNITTLATTVSTTTLRRFMLHAQSMACGTMVYGRYGSGHSLSAVLSVSAMDNYPLSSINKIGLSNPSYVTSCDVKIFAR